MEKINYKKTKLKQKKSKLNCLGVYITQKWMTLAEKCIYIDI